MSGDVNQRAIESFLPAARTRLSRALERLERCDRDPGDHPPFDEVGPELEALRAGAAACGLEALAEVAGIALRILHDVEHGRTAPDTDPMSHLVGICRGTGDFLDACAQSSPDAFPMLNELRDAARELRAPGAGGAGRSDASPLTPKAGQAAPGPLADVVPPEDVAPELAELFLAEAHDHLQSIGHALIGYRDDPRGDHLRDLRRTVHTLKGAAGMVGFRAVSQLAHRVEDLLDELFERQVTPAPEVLSLLFRSADLLQDLVEGSAPRAALERTLGAIHREHAGAFDRVRRSVPPPTCADCDSSRVEAPAPDASPAHAGVPGAPGPPRAAGPADPGRPTPGRPLRVPLSKLDDVVREVGELAVTRGAVEQHVQDLGRQLAELHLSVGRLHRLASRLETEYEALALGDSLQRRFGNRIAGSKPDGSEGFDELELDRYTDFHLISRELTETASDIGAVEHHLGRLRGEFDGSLARLVRLTRDLQDDFMALRLVPVATLRTRLERAVRVTAEQRGKLVDFVFEGDEHVLDAALVDQITEPLLHLLRNAVDHGIEPPGVRRAIGKPGRGRIAVRASREGDRLVIDIRDDGAGIDDERLRARAVARGFLTEAEALDAAAGTLRALLFSPGFSTADEVNEVSGRGVGLDVVKSRVEQMKGSVNVRSTRGSGSAFTVRLPLTLAVTRVLLVRAGGGTYAVPLAHVKEARRLDRASLPDGGPEPSLDLGDQVLPIVVLADALGFPRVEEAGRGRVVLLDVDVEGCRTGLVVDDVVDSRDAVYHPLPPHLSRLPCVGGTTLLGTGQVVVVLDLGEVVGRPGERRTLLPAGPKAPTGARPLTVVIVDDSLSVRRVISGLVAAAGWNAVEARDGMEALEVLQHLDEPPDVVLLDIEMPRLDGFELTETLRRQEAFRTVPIVMITSRGGDKHRRRAFAAGVTEFLVKPFQEETLMSLIRALACRRPGEAA